MTQSQFDGFLQVVSLTNIVHTLAIVLPTVLVNWFSGAIAAYIEETQVTRLAGTLEGTIVGVLGRMDNFYFLLVFWPLSKAFLACWLCICISSGDSRGRVCFQFLADPVEARVWSTNTIVIDSLEN